jgi:LPXTG-motif cell wall-anchored protein
MKKMKNLMATIASIILSFPFIAKAQQDSGTYIDNLNVQDSSYMEQDLLAGTETASSGNTTIIIIVVVVIIAVAAFVILKKKKKK